MIDDVARRATQKHSLSLRAAIIRIETLESDLVDLRAAYEALDDSCELVSDHVEDLVEERRVAHTCPCTCPRQPARQ